MLAAVSSDTPAERSRCERRLRARAHAAVRRAAIERAEGYRVHIEWALRQPPAERPPRPISFRAAANQLNARHLPSPYGGRWDGHQLMLMARRLGLAHPRGHLLRDEVRARSFEPSDPAPS